MPCKIQTLEVVDCIRTEMKNIYRRRNLNSKAEYIFSHFFFESCFVRISEDTFYIGILDLELYHIGIMDFYKDSKFEILVFWT